jgi:hypothetical protein
MTDSSNIVTAMPGASKAGVDSLPDDAPLELRKYTQHLKHCLARGRRRIEPLLMKE